MSDAYQPQIKSKSAILRRLSAARIDAKPLPNVIDGNWISYPDRYTKLAEVISFVGGSCRLVASEDQVLEDLRSYPEYQSAEMVWSNFPAIGGNVDLAAIEQPHDLEKVDFTIYQSHLAVAENGAVWVTDEQLRHRVIFFIAQHLVLIVNRSNIVDTLHQAYAQIKIKGSGFRCFISGPSKTADIEQSLVIGAHGCRSMMMYVIDQ